MGTSRQLDDITGPLHEAYLAIASLAAETNRPDLADLLHVLNERLHWVLTLYGPEVPDHDQTA